MVWPSGEIDGSVSVVPGGSCVSWTGFEPSGFMAKISELPLRFDSNAIVSARGATVKQLENCDVSFVSSSVAVAVTPSPFESPPTVAVQGWAASASTKVTKGFPAPAKKGALADGVTKDSE